MKQDATIHLFQYWNRLRNGRPAPRRTEIEPADIKALLADTFILERDTRGEPVFRLAGTRLCAMFGQELKGFSFNSLWAEKDRRVMKRLAEAAFTHNSVVVVAFDGFSGNGRTNGFELLILPLDGGQDHPRVLGSIVAAGRPFWLGADPIREGAVSTLRIVDPDRDPVFLKNRPDVPVPPLAPDGGAFVMERRGTGDAGRRIRHLVVIEGGREE